MGQERMNIFTLDLMQKTGRVECLLAVNDRGVQWYVQPHLDEASLRYRKMRFCWNVRKSLNLRHWWLHLSDIVKGNVQFYRIWREFRPDYIHCGNAFHAMTLLPVLSWVGTPLVFYLGDRPAQRCALEHWLWLRLIDRVRTFICISAFIRDCLNAIKDVSEKTKIVYNYPPERKLKTVRAAAFPRAAPEVFTVAYMGQILAIKGVDILVDAAIIFLERHPDSRFIIAGPTEPAHHQPFAQALIDKVAKRDLREKIIFTGMLEDIPALLEICQVHICPSVCEEALSIVVPEAKVSKCPSIIFPSGGLPELIHQRVDGFICAGKTSSDLLEALEYYHALPDWGRQQGAAAFESMKRLGITREHFLAEWLEVYGLEPATKSPCPDILQRR